MVLIFLFNSMNCFYAVLSNKDFNFLKVSGQMDTKYFVQNVIWLSECFHVYKYFKQWMKNRFVFIDENHFQIVNA